MRRSDSSPSTRFPLAKLDLLFAAFEEAWRQKEPPAIDSYLPATEMGRLIVLCQLVRTDLESRLKAGEAARVEPYLRRYPELSQDADLVLDLITAVRRRPGMYIGDTSDGSGLHHLVHVLVESVLLNPMSTEDHKEIAHLLGVTPAQLQPPIVLRDPPIFVPKDKQGKEDGKVKPAPKGPRGFAVVLAQAGAGKANEIRRLLNSRPAPRPGTVQVYLVLHEEASV